MASLVRYDAEGRGALGEQRLRTILSDMGLEPETVAAEKLAIEALFSSLRASGAMNCDPSNGELRVPSMEFLRVMQAQEFLVGEMGRYWVALSLREAETLRGALHAAMDGETALVPNSKVAVGLRIGDLLLDAVGGAKGDTDGRPDDYHQPPRLQLQSAVQAFRLIDCQHAFSHAQTRLLLRMLRADAPEDRKRWVVDTSACRRRPQARIENMRGSGLIQILTVEDEYHLLVHAAHVWRIKHELRRKQLGVHDIFFAFNQTRNGLLSCGELGAGLTWLGLPFGESELIALLKGLDKDTDGLLSLEEWSAGFPELPSSEPATQEKLAELELKPMRVKELYEGSVLKRLAIPVRPEALAKFKFKLKPHKSFTLVWSNKGSGALHDVSIWAPEIEARIEKKSHARVCFGHMPVSGFESPSKAGEPQLLEVTDTAVGMLASSESMSAVVDQLLPHPLRYRLAWHDAHAKPPLYIWRAVPPSADFVAVGMIATSSDDQPELTAMRCVPTRWLSAEKEEPKKVWQHGGQIGGRTGTFWSTNQLNVLLAMHGQEPPPKDQRWFFTTDRFMAEPNKLADLVPAPPPPEGTLASTSNPNVPIRSKTSFFGGKKEVAKPQAPSGMPIAAAANAAVKAPPAVDKAAEIAKWLEARASGHATGGGATSGGGGSLEPAVSNPFASVAPAQGAANTSNPFASSMGGKPAVWGPEGYSPPKLNPTPAPATAPTPVTAPAPVGGVLFGGSDSPLKGGPAIMPGAMLKPTPSPLMPTPAPMLAPTPAPMLAPTPAPMLMPTPAPMLAPTPAPMLAPTPAPMLAPTPAPMPASPPLAEHRERAQTMPPTPSAPMASMVPMTPMMVTPAGLTTAPSAGAQLGAMDAAMFGGIAPAGGAPASTAPPLDATWQKACLQSEGLIQASPLLQVGFKADFRGHAGRIGIYYGNLTPAPLKVLSIEVVIPPTVQGKLACTAAAPPTTLAPGQPVLQMISLELTAPFAAPPYLIVKLEGAARPIAINLPVYPARFSSPWPLSKDDYFGMWRAPNLKETQARITFNAAHEVSTIKAMLMNYVKLAVLEGVDPSPNNICAAGAIVCLNAPMPPAPGSHHCLLRIEIIPGYAKAPDGSPRAASRITARSTSPEAAEMLVGALAAYLG